MAKLLFRATALFLFGVAFAGTAAAQAITEFPYAAKLATPKDLGGSELRYAAELFGPGSDEVVLEYGENDAGDETKLYVYLILLRSAPNGLAADSTGTVTFRFHGATFDAPIRGSNFSLVQLDYTAGVDAVPGANPTPAVPPKHALAASGTVSPLQTANREGGGRGDNEITIDITNSAPAPHSNPANDAADGAWAIRLEVPPLTETASAMSVLGKGIRVSAELAGSTSAATNWPRFPSQSQIRDRADRVTLIPPASLDLGGGIKFPSYAMSVSASSWEAHPDPEKTLPTRKVKILSSAPTHLTGIQFLSRTDQYLRMANVAVGINANPMLPTFRQADGNVFSVRSRRGGGRGYLDVDITGNVRDGDRFWLDANGDEEMDSDEVMEVSDGEASGSFELDSMFFDEDGEELDPAAMPLTYWPNGKDRLRNGRITARFTVDFEEDTNTSALLSTRVPADLEYSAGTAIKAYALAPMSSGDETNVRIRCGKAVDCTVYMSCDSADGMNFYGAMADKIPAWSVATVGTGMIAEVVGAEDADFAGRMSCNVIGGTEVQVLTRSNGTLVNNSYVGN